jgi:hypothetical protein
MNISPTPPAGVIRQQKCPVCSRAFAICRTDLLRPDIVFPGCYPAECPDCMDYQLAELPELARTMKHHRARMHEIAAQFHAACG